MVRADIHIEQALELEMNFMRRFIDYAISQFKRLMNYPDVDIDELEKTYRHGINVFFGKSLQRMLGIINNVRSSVTDDYAQEALEKVRSEALQALEIAKAE
jgi:fructose-1,6-bisphosphatase